ncbi:unnamed protein product [Durusdinium trenchii]|uniref:Peptidase C1A papain C-terminal domain-containing protein n=2 Tax=Durusdinium trenchii TaxID=1381693 RepID=A0ABP0K8V5_9DINO
MGACESKGVTEDEIKVDVSRHPAMQSMDLTTTQKMGWIKDIPDPRDLYMTFKSVDAPKEIKRKGEGSKEIVDLRPLNGGFKIFNQGHLGSCTANALAAAFHFALHKENVEQHEGFKDFTPSRLFIYYNERYVEGSVDRDAGAMLRDGIQVMERLGVCPEAMWKYDDQNDFFKKQPDKNCYELATKCTVKGYAHVAQDLQQMKLCIKNGYPFVFGFTVLTSFSEAAKNGTMVMPQPGDKARGGHAVCAVGYDDFKQCFIVRNSWGDDWGDKGYFYMPYEYICKEELAHDFWAINWVEGGVLAQRRAQRRVLPAAFTAVHLHPQYLSCELHGHTWTHFRHLLWQATSSESRAFVSHEWKEATPRWSCSALRSELLLEIFEMALELERGPRAAVLKKVNATNSALKLLSSAGGVCLFGYVNALAVALRIAAGTATLNSHRWDALDMNSKRCSVELLDGTFQVQQREWLRVLQTLWRSPNMPLLLLDSSPWPFGLENISEIIAEASSTPAHSIRWRPPSGGGRWKLLPSQPWPATKVLVGGDAPREVWWLRGE